MNDGKIFIWGVTIIYDREAYNAYHRNYRAMKGSEMREWRRKYNKRYRHKNKHQYERQYHYNYYPANKYKSQAHRKVQLAIKKGTLKRLPCEISSCLTTETVAHHNDYEKPLVVLFVCKHHHSVIHRFFKMDQLKLMTPEQTARAIQAQEQGVHISP